MGCFLQPEAGLHPGVCLFRHPHIEKKSPEQWALTFEHDPLCSFLATRPDSHALRNGDLMPDDQYRASPHHLEVARPEGWFYRAVIPIADQGRLLGCVTLHRTEPRGDFTDKELAELDALRPWLAAAILGIEKFDRCLAGIEAHKWLFESLGEALLVLDEALHPVFATRAALDQCLLWNHGGDAARALNPHKAFALPAAIAAAAQSVSGSKTMETVAAPRRGLGHAEVRWDADNGEPGLVAVRLAPPVVSSDSRPSLPPGLTHAECAVCARILLGESNQAVANALGIGVDTVKKHLTSIYHKTGCRNRNSLMASVLGRDSTK